MWFYLAGLLSLILVALDQCLKLWVQANVTSANPVVIIPNVVSLTNVENRGAAWNLLTGHRFFLIALTILVLIVLVYYLWQSRFDYRYALTLALLTAGAVGNLINRVISGSVIDMFQLDFVNFPVFNVADSCLTVGILILIWLIWTQSPLRSQPR